MTMKDFKYEIDFTVKFKKDLKLAKKQRKKLIKKSFCNIINYNVIQKEVIYGYNFI